MGMKNVLFLMAITTLIMSQSLVFAATEDPIQVALTEASRSFTYQSKPIHPGLIQEFSSSIADPGLPTTITVDIAAPHSNEYFDGDVKGEEGFVCADKEGESFCYKWLGRMQNGLHVLMVSEGGTGSGVFGDLFFVRFDKGEGYAKDGKKYDRLLMSIVRTYNLGDRDDGEIKVLSDRVVVGKSRYRDKDVTLRF